ncbi:MAG: YaiO family outer membrane beta-barrel protein [Wenzhouxiangellaceae bacterium]|nr:YaiO family outer membrane beta-barrel protein [Wenzhouxiangellaceae bacterium]
MTISAPVFCLCRAQEQKHKMQRDKMTGLQQRSWSPAFQTFSAPPRLPCAVMLIVALTSHGARAQAAGEEHAAAAAVPTCERATGALYSDGRAALAAGDAALAQALLGCAAERQPGNTDILLFLGLAQAAQDKWAAAEDTLERGLSIAPDYTDIRIALARLHYWQQAYAKAASIIAPALDAPEPRPEALALAGRIALAAGQPERARDLLAQAVQRRPKDADLHLALGDAQLAAGDRKAARSSYHEASRLASDGETALQRLEGLRRRPWEVGGFTSYSDLSGGRDSWVRGVLAASRELSQATTLVANLAVEDRGFARDETLDVRVDHQLTDAFGGFVETTVSPAADFRADWEVEGGVRVRLRSGGQQTPGASWLLADARHLEFDGKTVEIFQPALRQYLLDGRLSLEARYIGVWDSEGGYLDGVKGRADLILSERLHLFAGGALAPETERDVPPADFRTVDTVSAFGGIRWILLPNLTLDVSFAHNDREDSYERRTLTAGLSVKF